MPRKGHAKPITNNKPGFHLNMPISELTEHVTRAIEASVISSALLIRKSEDGVTHETRSTPTEPHGAQGLKRPNPKLGDRGSKASPWRA